MSQTSIQVISAPRTSSSPGTPGYSVRIPYKQIEIAQSVKKISLPIIGKLSEFLSSVLRPLELIRASTTSRFEREWLCKTRLGKHISDEDAAAYAIQNRFGIPKSMKEFDEIKKSREEHLQEFSQQGELTKDLASKLFHLERWLEEKSEDYASEIRKTRKEISKQTGLVLTDDEILTLSKIEQSKIEAQLAETKVKLKNLLICPKTNRLLIDAVSVTTAEQTLVVSAQYLGLKLQKGTWVENLEAALSEEAEKLKREIIFIRPNFAISQLAESLSADPDFIEKVDLGHPALAEAVSFEPFNNPHILQCGHSFNEETLAKLNSPKCPTCRKEILQEKTPNIPLNEFVELLLQQAQLQKKLSLSQDLSPELNKLVDRAIKLKSNLKMHQDRVDDARKHFASLPTHFLELSEKIKKEGLELENLALQLAREFPKEKMELLEAYKKGEKDAVQEIELAKKQLQDRLAQDAKESQVTAAALRPLVYTKLFEELFNIVEFYEKRSFERLANI